MAWYYCELCERERDEYFHGCVEHPNDECECICEECAQRLEALYDFDEAEEEAKIIEELIEDYEVVEDEESLD